MQIPAAFRLIMMVFEGKERANAITIFSLTGAVANAAGKSHTSSR